MLKDIPQMPGMPKMIDNVNLRVRDDLEETITKKSKLRIVAACFSIYAYEELKKSLSGIEDLQFIFTSPTFTADKAEKSKKEFYIPRMTREKNLYGSEFEIRLRNELTQKAIAKECAEWIKRKAKFKSNTTEQEAIEAEKERVRAERRAANPEGQTQNTSKKKLQKQMQLEAEAAKAAAKKEYEARKGMTEDEAAEEAASVLSGIPERPYCKGRNYDPNHYGRKSTEE